MESDSLRKAKVHMMQAVQLLRLEAAARPRGVDQQTLLSEAAHLEQWANDEIDSRDPFRGELTIYRHGAFVMGINAPFIDAALESLHKAIGDAMFPTATA